MNSDLEDMDIVEKILQNESKTNTIKEIGAQNRHSYKTFSI